VRCEADITEFEILNVLLRYIFNVPEAHNIHLTVSSLFLIGFVMGGGGGAARAGRLSSFMHLSSPNRAIKVLYAPAPPPPTIWALKSLSWSLVHKTTYAPMIYTALCITWASGRALGPGNLEFLGPQMALAYRLNVILQGPKNYRYPGPNPGPLALVMDMHYAHIQNIMQGAV
jgi:hypothetical protein